jgi:hypothetical protein
LIHLICDAGEALSAVHTADRLQFLPSLRQYGALQALLLLSRLSTSLLNFGADIDNKPAHEWLPNHIGIWYDFACLPQMPRSNQQEQEVQASLLALPSLIQSDEISLIAIRDAGDDYETRGWCFMEARLSSHNLAFTPLVLRLDRLGTMSDYQLPEIASPINVPQAEQFKAALAAWESNRTDGIDVDTIWKTIVYQACIGPDLLPLSEEESPVLSLEKFIQPSIAWIALLLADLIRLRGRTFDFSEVILRLFKEKGLHCSKDSDLVYTGLLALLWSCHKESRFAELFRQCLRRHIINDGLFMRAAIVEKSNSPDSQDNANIDSENLSWEFVEKD